jgi:hypothetical protein
LEKSENPSIPKVVLHSTTISLAGT